MISYEDVNNFWETNLRGSKLKEHIHINLINLIKGDREIVF